MLFLKRAHSDYQYVMLLRQQETIIQMQEPFETSMKIIIFACGQPDSQTATRHCKFNVS